MSRLCSLPGQAHKPLAARRAWCRSPSCPHAQPARTLVLQARIVLNQQPLRSCVEKATQLLAPPKVALPLPQMSLPRIAWPQLPHCRLPNTHAHVPHGTAPDADPAAWCGTAPRMGLPTAVAVAACSAALMAHACMGGCLAVSAQPYAMQPPTPITMQPPTSISMQHAMSSFMPGSTQPASSSMPTTVQPIGRSNVQADIAVEEAVSAKDTQPTSGVVGEEGVTARVVGSTASAVYCQATALSNALKAFATDPAAGDGFDGAGSVPALLAYYRRLGCTPSELDTGLKAAFGDMMQGTTPGDGFLLTDDVMSSGLLVSARPYLLQLGLTGAAALVLLCWQDRPLGWVADELVETRPSTIAGTGLFARVDIPAGTSVGAYPGRVRTPAEMLIKREYAPMAAQYAFLTRTGLYLDPTDNTGNPSPWPTPGWPWWQATPTQLSYANEPPRNGTGTNCFVEDGEEDNELLFVTNRPITAGEEIFIDYGLNYDRSGYSK